MRIALVAPQSSSPRSREAAGPGQRISSLAEALAGLGHQVTVYAPNGSRAKASLAPGVTVEHLPSGDGPALDIPAFSDHLARRWRQAPPDIAHAHFWSSGLAALAGARGLNLPVVQTFHSLGTLHANRPREALTRLENMVGMSGINLPAKAVRQQIAAAVHMILQVSRMRDGMRRIVAVTEVVGMEGEIITTQDLFTYQYEGEGADGKLKGSFNSSGLRPHFTTRAEYYGLDRALMEAIG